MPNLANCFISFYFIIISIIIFWFLHKVWKENGEEQSRRTVFEADDVVMVIFAPQKKSGILSCNKFITTLPCERIAIYGFCPKVLTLLKPNKHYKITQTMHNKQHRVRTMKDIYCSHQYNKKMFFRKKITFYSKHNFLFILISSRTHH